MNIGIVGSDNSHAIAYSKLANIDRVTGDEARVVAIWGQEPARTREVAEKGQIETIVDAPEDLIGKVDAVFVVDRHGDLHADHTIPFLARGIPVYVDKPLAISLDDSRRILDAARASNTFVTSFSSLRVAPETTALANQLDALGDVRAAHIAGPCDFASQYGGPFFYATHVIEIALRLLGDDVRSVRAARTGKTVAVQVGWANDALATFTYLGDAAYHFHATLFGKEGMAASEIRAGEAGYAETLTAVLTGMRTGKRPYTDEQLLRPIAMVHAIQQSLDRDGASIDIASLLDKVTA